MYTIQMVRGMRVPVQNRVKWDMSAPEIGAVVGLAEVTPTNPMETRRLEAVVRQQVMDLYYGGKIDAAEKDSRMHRIYKGYYQ